MDTMMELEIGPGPEPGSYVVHVLRSVGGGEPSQAITLDLEELVARRPLLEATVLSSSVSARRVMSDTEATVQDVGRRLFESTFSGEVRSAYRTSMAVASERGKGVQIALRLTAPGLAALPWETLFDAETGVYLCRKEPLVRHVPAPHSPAALAIEPPMRVLGMISSPRGLPALDVSGERERLEEALRPHLDSGRVELKWLDEVTWTGVHRKLLEEQWHVLHFVGHGTYDVETDEGVLAFVGRDGRADYVTATSLADLLDEAEPTPRLVVLNSCQSGAGGTTDLFSGTAAALAHSGIRAVAAMQFSISDIAAIEFARGFYTALAHGRSIDEAVRSGRIGILGMGRGTLEWVTPVLYLRGEDTQVFDVAPMPDADASRAPGTPPAHESLPLSQRAPEPASPSRNGPDATSDTKAATGPQGVARPIHAPDSGDTPATVIPIIRAPAPPQSLPPTDPDLPSPPASRPIPPSSPPSRPVPLSPPRTTAVPPPPPPTRPPGSPPTDLQSNRTSPARRGARWKRWVVVGILAAVLGSVVAVVTFNAATGPIASSPSPSTSPSPSEPIPVRVERDAQWTPTGVSCVAGDVFNLKATGDLDLDGDDPTPRVGPRGWLGDEIGLQSAYRGGYLHAGALYVGDASLMDDIEGATIERYTMFNDDGTARHTCGEAHDLWLLIDDSDTTDNLGGYDVTIVPEQRAG